jgi:hypothetical protein
MTDTIIVAGLLSAIVAYIVCRMSAGRINTSDKDKENNVQKRILTEDLLVIDKDSKPRLILSASTGDPGAGFFDENGGMRMFLGLDKTGQPFIRTVDSNQKPQMTIGQQWGHYNLTFHDAEGIPRGVFGSNPDGASLEFAGADGKLRTLVGVDNGTSGLQVFNKKGDKMAELAFDDSLGQFFGPHLLMFDKNLKPRIIVNSGKLPSVILCDENGKHAGGLHVIKDLPGFMLVHPNERSALTSAIDAVREAIKEGKDSTEASQIFQKALDESKKGKYPEKSVFIFPGFASGLKPTENLRDPNNSS